MTPFLNLLYQLAVLALVVLGLGIVFGLLGVMNMAHGEFIALGAYAVVMAQQAHWPLWSGVLLALLIGGGAGWLTDALLIRHLAGRPFDTFLATWGLSGLLRGGLEAWFGKGYQSIDDVAGGVTAVAGTPYPTYRLVLIAAVATGLVLLALWYRRSPTGARLQAMVHNPTLAEAMGLNTRRMASAAFVVGTMAATLAGALLAPLVRIEPAMGLDYLLVSFFVLVVGGLSSLLGLVAGVGVIGSVQSLVSAAVGQTSGYLAVLLVSIGFLWLRPNGLVRPR